MEGYMDFLKQAQAVAVLELLNQSNLALATNPETIIKAARDGDIPACVVVMMATRDHTLANSHAMEALDMFVSHIVKSCPLDKASFEQSRLSEISFMGISFIILFFLKGAKDPRLRPFQEALPEILEWTLARYVYKSAPEKYLLSDYRDIKSLAMFTDAIHMVRSNEDVKLALRDPRWLKLSMVIWLDPNPDTIPAWKLTQMGHFRCYIDEVLINYGDVPTHVPFIKALDDLQAAADGDPEVLIEPCLKFLTKQTSDLHIESSVLNGAADVLARFSGVSSHPVTQAVKKKGSLAVSKALARLADPSPPKGDGSLFDTFSILAAIVSSFSGPEDEPTWLLRALQAGLLAHIASRSSKLHEAYAQCVALVNTLFSQDLPAHLSNPSVIFATENALSELSARDHDQLMNSVHADSWKTFIHRFFEQYVFYCYFEAAGTRKGCYKCGKAENSDKASALKRCGRCKVVEYCTGTCQTTDWPEHKNNCKLLRDKKHGPPTRWSLAPFRRRLEAYDVRRHLPGIRALAQRKYPGYSMQTICTLLHYGTFPPRLSVALKTEASISHELLVLQASDPMVREPCFDDVRLHDGSSGILSAVEYIDGKYTPAIQRFHWSMPYFCSSYGTQRPDSYAQKSLATAYVGDDDGVIATTWSVVDEIAYRTKMSPETITSGNIGEIRGRVIEAVKKEKARMNLRPDSPTAPTCLSSSGNNGPSNSTSVFDNMGTAFLQGVADSIKSTTGPPDLVASTHLPAKRFPMDPELIRQREEARYKEHLSVFNSIPPPWEVVREKGENVWFLNMEGRNFKPKAPLVEEKPLMHNHELIRWPETRWDDLVFPVSDTEGSDSNSTIDGGDY